ncbi:MAG: efflux RND transporter periplasmic adaptor subunit [Campylobacteraceae bacterium]|jgi:macrolide-specific efflux system membrane fusion protein|nr:efflux RND transporter periplasmic adaptor subunit [Campylobacteraceae bacterium]
MRKKKIISIAVLTAIAIGCLSYGLYKLTGDTNSQIQTVKVTMGDIENTVTATGMVNPKSYVDVGSQISGQVTKLYVEVGDIVKTGDLLAEIDKTVLETKVESSKAELAYQIAQLQDREAKLTLARLAYERQKELLANNAVSKESFESAQAAFLSAEASITMIKAQIVQTESSLKENRANLEYAKIYAPMSGTVSSISVKQGQTLNANQNTPTILQIADLSTVTIESDVSEADVTKLKKGMDVYFKTLGSTNIWRTNLLKIEPTPKVNNNVVLYKAIFDVNNTSGDLMNSMTTQVFFVLSSAKNALVIPVTAVSRRDASNNRAAVMLKQKDGSLAPQKVELGISNRVYVEVLSGLNEGDEISANFAPVVRKPPSNTNVQNNQSPLQGNRQRVPFGIMR